jgi:hypothetical protein
VEKYRWQSWPYVWPRTTDISAGISNLKNSQVNEENLKKRYFFSRAPQRPGSPDICRGCPPLLGGPAASGKVRANYLRCIICIIYNQALSSEKNIKTINIMQYGQLHITQNIFWTEHWTDGCKGYKYYFMWDQFVNIHEEFLGVIGLRHLVWKDLVTSSITHVQRCSSMWCNLVL